MEGSLQSKQESFMKGLFAGLDVSTQICKIVVINCQSGSVEFVDAIQYDTDLPEYETKNGVIQNQPEGVSESDPEMWIEALHKIFNKLKSSSVPLDQIKCISVSGQQHLEDGGDIAVEGVDCGDQQGKSDDEQGLGGDEQRQEQNHRREGNSGEQDKAEQDYQGEQEVEEVGADAGERHHDGGDVHLFDEVGVCDDAIGRLVEGSGEENPGQ